MKLKRKRKSSLPQNYISKKGKTTTDPVQFPVQFHARCHGAAMVRFSHSH